MKTKLLITFFVIATIGNAQYTKLLYFSGIATGRDPYGSLISDGTFLYGMTKYGGVSTNFTGDLGVIFKIKPDGTGYSTLLDFSGAANGSYPNGSLISDGTFLYGMTGSGGTNDEGTIFKIKPDGTGYSKLLDFSGTANGSYPNGSLISDGTFLYGMTVFGGTNDEGTIFKIKPDGTGYFKLLDFFNNTNGSQPQGDLFFDGTFLYGMAEGGGTNGVGVLFKIKPDGTGYSTLLDFSSANGLNPFGSLISDGTFLYGMTRSGGTNSYGVIFKIKPDGTGYSKLLDFSGTANGRYPYGSLVSDGTFLYGMTMLGGTNDSGVVFKIKPDGTGYSKLLDFSGAANGSYPSGSLISDGTFLYGMTTTGGTNSMGVIYKYHPIGMAIAENNYGNDFTFYPNPFSMQTTLQTSNFFKDATLTVYNSFGQTVKQIKNISGQTITLHRDNLSSGLYFIRLTQDNQTITTDKLIITD